MALLRSTGRSRRSALVALAIAAAMIMSMAGAALAASTIGNAAIPRAYSGGWHNFTILDTNNPATSDGYFDEVEFYARGLGTINFVVVSQTGIVTFVSDDIAVTSTGLQTVLLNEPAGVTAGDNLGFYTHVAGPIAFDIGIGTDVMYTPNNSGKPAVDDAFNDISGYQLRTYSMNATIYANSPDVCKNGGWESYGDFKNQGQCIASFVANDNAEPHN